MALGFGSADFNAVGGDLGVLNAQKAELSGLAAHLSVDLGTAPVDNWIVHLRLSLVGRSEPNLRLDGKAASRVRGSSISEVLIGPAATYYFMPIDIYLTGALGLSITSFDDGHNHHDSDTGIGLNLDLGKEWWVGDDWGLGVAARFFYARSTKSPGGNGGNDYELLSWGLLFSATYQ